VFIDMFAMVFSVPPHRMTRDIRLVHRFLLASGRVVPVGERFPAGQPPPLDDLRRAVDRVRGLFGIAATGESRAAGRSAAAATGR